MAFVTAGEILNRVVSETGLADEAQDPYASADPLFVQLRRLLQSVATDLLDARPVWPHLVKPYTFTTVAGQTAYPLPSDFRSMVYQTGWNKGLRSPLAGPATPAEWQRILNFGAGVSLQLIFRLSPLTLSILPVPPDGLEVTYEYASANWASLNGGTTPTLEGPTSSSDKVWFDDGLAVRALKLKVLQARGFDTTVAAREYSDALAGAVSRSGSAPVLALSRRSPALLGLTPAVTTGGVVY